MPEGIIDFLRGGTMVAFFAIAVFFFRSWRRTKDVFFLSFGAAFLTMAAEQKVALFTGGNADLSPAAYWLRILAFLLIICGIVVKNLPDKNKVRE